MQLNPHQPSLFSVVEPKSDPFLEEEMEEFFDEAVSHTSADQILPFVCSDCESIGGYYAASFREIACPHCGGSAHPMMLRGRHIEALHAGC